MHGTKDGGVVVHHDALINAPSLAPRRIVDLTLAEVGKFRLDQGIERMERAYRTLSEDEPDEGLAMLAAEIGRLHFFRGTSELGASAFEEVDRAFEMYSNKLDNSLKVILKV